MLLAALVLTVATTSAITGIVPTRAVTARANDVTASHGTLRDGWDRNEPVLSPSVVGGGTFGQLFSTAVNGAVYAQPLVVKGTVIVATETDWVYGLNGQTGAVEWERQLGAPWPTSQIGCRTVGAYSGVTSTPVYDPHTGEVYLAAVTVPPGNPVSKPAFDLFGLNAQTGQIALTVPIQGSPANDPGRQFTPATELQRPALLLQNGWVYAAFGSYCDYTPYTGYVAGVNVTSSAVTLWSDESGISNNMAGIWQSGGGLMSDSSGRIFLTSGNGVSPAPGPGKSPPGQLAESVVRLAVQKDGTLAAKDFFSPADAPLLDAYDEDFGSGAPVGLPVGTAAYPYLLVQAGKDGRVMVLNRNNLGGREQGPGGADAYLSVAGPFEGLWGHPAVFDASTTRLAAGDQSENDFVYYLGTGESGVAAPLRALRLGADSSDVPTLTDAADSASVFGYGSGSPVVTSDGTDPSTAVVWVIGEDDRTGANGTLYAFDAAPQQVNGSLQLREIWSAPIGTASKFAVPATDGGHVYVGTRDGHVLGFGSPDVAPFTGATPLSFSAPVGATQSQTVTVTATATAAVAQPTVNAPNNSNVFTVGQVALNGSPATSFPVTVQPGDQLSVPVTFSPSSPGGATGTLTLNATSTGGLTYPPLGVSLTGAGTQDGLSASPGTLAFGASTPIPVGVSVPLTVQIANYGTTTATITSAQGPSAPFSASLPASGATISPGQSLPVTVTYTPTTPNPADQGSFTIDGSTGNVTVSLTGDSVADDSALTASPGSVDFGSVPLGQQATASVSITNSGNLPATVTFTSQADMPFGTPSRVAKKLPLNPGYGLQIPVTFTPTSIGAVSWNYRLTWTDVVGTHTLSVPVTGSGVAPGSGLAAIPPPGGGWRLNGAARMSGTSLVLTPATEKVAGSAVYPVPVPSDGLTAQFTAQIGGGTGANGMTFSLLDPATSSPKSIGGYGWALGYARLSGVAVVLDTFKTSGDPSSNFIGIATGSSGRSLIFAATSTAIPPLRQGAHTVSVSVSAGVMTVSLDGVQYLSASVSLPPSALVAFTGATGTRTDIHTVSGVSITAGGNPLPPPGGGWSFNPSAAMTHSAVSLTPKTAQQAGSAVYPVPVPTAGLQVVFNAQLGPADGLTFALLDPSTESATAVGGSGADLGFGGLNGVALALATHKESGFPSYNFMGISTGTNQAGTSLTFLAVARAVPRLTVGTHTVSVDISATDLLTVVIDGETVFQRQAPPLPANALLAFTASTGSVVGIHRIRTVAISTTG